MSSPENNHNQDDDTLHPLNVSDTLLRLERGEPGKTKLQSDLDVIKEIKALYMIHGTSAIPLIDALIEYFEAGKLKTGISSIIYVYIDTKYRPLLKVIGERDDIPKDVNQDMCTLFEDGISKLEPYLLDYLWENWQNPEGRYKSYVVDALGKSGGTEALKILESIRIRLEGIVPAQQAALPDIDEDEPSYRRLFDNDLSTAESNERMLDNVHNAIRRMKERGLGQ